MAPDSQWVRLTECATGFEADLLRTALEEAEIPVILRSPQIGIFGAGFSGPVIGGIELHVPASAIDRAREIMEDHGGPEDA